MKKGWSLQSLTFHCSSACFSVLGDGHSPSNWRPISEVPTGVLVSSDSLLDVARCNTPVGVFGSLAQLPIACEPSITCIKQVIDEGLYLYLNSGFE